MLGVVLPLTSIGNQWPIARYKSRCQPFFILKIEDTLAKSNRKPCKNVALIYFHTGRKFGNFTEFVL